MVEPIKTIKDFIKQRIEHPPEPADPRDFICCPHPDLLDCHTVQGLWQPQGSSFPPCRFESCSQWFTDGLSLSGRMPPAPRTPLLFFDQERIHSATPVLVDRETGRSRGRSQVVVDPDAAGQSVCKGEAGCQLAKARRILSCRSFQNEEKIE